MPTYTQANRPFTVTTPLGKDVLLLTGFQGHEAISQLFNFQVDLLAETQSEIHFDRIVGQNVTVEMRLANEEKRYFNGMVKRFSQGARDESFVHFRAELVPKLWLLTKKVRSCIFQHLSVPDILRRVFSELDVTYEISGTYYPRDYCVQYRESDFDFASRLMEEEGIYYFFKHGDASHEMVVTDMANQHPSVPGQSNVVYEEISGGVRKDMRITSWEKTQELRSGEYTLWDHCFEFPGKNLQAKGKTIDSVTVGEVTHKLSVGGNDHLKIYDYPGGYAQRFGGIDRNGGARPQDLKNIFPDGERTVRIRMEQEEVASLEIRGASNCGHFVAGHKFTLERHFDANDRYLLTSVDHDARLDGNYRSNQAMAFHYENRFTCIPVALPYRPHRVTRKPVIAGVQTATVVGPGGEKIFCDKYGRVKVQFHWDREGKNDADSSCWIRVSQPWGGKGWGGMFIPHVGQEVVVTFKEGDPDRPLISGRVYNPDQMPPIALPAGKSKSVIRDHGGNEIIMEGAGGSQQMRLHSPTHDTTMTLGNSWITNTLSYALTTVGESIEWLVGTNWIAVVKGNQTWDVHGYKKTRVLGGKSEQVVGIDMKTITGLKTERILGGSVSITAPSKNEVIMGASVKIIKGEEFKKRPGLKEWVGGMNFLKTKYWKSKATEVDTSADKEHHKVSGKDQFDCGEFDVHAKNDCTLRGKPITIDSSDKLHLLASGETLITGSDVNVKGHTFDVHNGTFSVK
jgi:type VI secretion system secreted protein VgrG